MSLAEAAFLQGRGGGWTGGVRQKGKERSCKQLPREQGTERGCRERGQETAAFPSECLLSCVICTDGRRCPVLTFARPGAAACWALPSARPDARDRPCSWTDTQCVSLEARQLSCWSPGSHQSPFCSSSAWGRGVWATEGNGDGGNNSNTYFLTRITHYEAVFEMLYIN